MATDMQNRLNSLGRGLHAAGLAITLTTAVAFYVAILMPLDRQAALYEDNVARLQILLGDAAKLRGEHARLTQTLSDAKLRVAAMQGRIPDEPLEGEFLGQITQAAHDVGLTIQDYRPGAVSANRVCSQIEVSLSCAGDYRSLCAFLDRLTKLPRVSRILRMEVTADLQKSYPVKMTMLVFFNIHNTPESKQATKSDG